jgi:hypothetical protein
VRLDLGGCVRRVFYARQRDGSRKNTGFEKQSHVGAHAAGFSTHGNETGLEKTLVLE